MSADGETSTAPKTTMTLEGNSSNSGDSAASSGNISVQTVKQETPQNTTAPLPPPKTDKPRPHVCGTCSRSFARLEHLKRHERSHTKEKPFECPQCTRCFARRDLLLRHQQKLHQQGHTSSRPRNGRRESTTAVPMSGAGRVRKNSVASNGTVTSGVGVASMRPRANTISHIDPNAINSLLASHHNASAARGMGSQPGHSHHPSLTGFSGPGMFDYRGMSTSLGNHGQPHALPKLDTHIGLGLGGGLRTAPVPGFGSDDYDLEKFFGSSASTINPNQLHAPFNGALGTPASPFGFGNPFAQTPSIDEDGFGWNTSLDNSMMFPGPNENVIDGSSPSAISTASQSGFSEVMLDGSGQQNSAAIWQHQLLAASGVNAAPYSLEAMAPVFPELMLNNTVSPKELQDQGTNADIYFSSPPPVSSLSPSAGVARVPNQYFHPPMAFSSDSTSISSSMTGSGRHSSVTSVSTDTITDATRQALMMNLSQALSYGHSQRKYSQPHISPLSASTGKPQNQVASLPSTLDLQRYVNAYIQYFHPHLPFLHIPTLSFDTPTYTYHVRSATTFNHDGMVGGGGCLILAMAAIGALYEFDPHVATELFDAAKKMILYYLDERRRAGLSAAVSGSNSVNDSINKPPLWLVQAMLLNLIFGHNSGDRQAAEVASTHCAALVSLAKAAELDTTSPEDASQRAGNMDGDVDMSDAQIPSDTVDEHAQWMQWKRMEERKRTYFAVFAMSSLLVSAYAHAPRILNSEIRLDLPCEEDLWSAENSQVWAARGGPAVAQSKSLSFHTAMTYLLEANLRQQSQSRVRNSFSHQFGSNGNLDETAESEIRPSTFGCYVLINALHVYIWETRQRHTGRLWKVQETELMYAQVEPALKAWQAAWRANPNHSIERPSPYGPLSADCIPLLDLAYVRLFIDLGRSKELLWQRDFDGMAAELAKGVEIVAQSDGSPDRTSDTTESTRTNHTSSTSPGAVASPRDMDLMAELSPGHSAAGTQPTHTQSSKRERHLRKAAFYAADSLLMADSLRATYAEFTARELPNSSAMCAFDCAQILAEWVATVQDRVGRYLGVLGRDEIDFSTVPGIMLLEEEDIKLLQKIAEILHHAERKLTMGFTDMSRLDLPSFPPCGFGAKLLLMTAYLLEKSAVWPVTHVMAGALKTHAAHMIQRVEASTTV